MASNRINTVRDTDQVKRILEANARTRIIEITEVPSVQELRQLLSKNRPVVIRKAAANWPLVKRWSDKRELIALAEKEALDEPRRKYTIYQPEADGHLNQSHAAPVSQLSFARYLEIVEKTKRPLYLLGVPDLSGKGSSPLEPKPGQESTPVFAADLEISSPHFFFLDLFKEAEAVRRHVFFNAGYSFTNLHFDSDWNTYLCAVGSRRWTLAHPSHAPFLGHTPSANYSKLRPTSSRLTGKLTRLIRFRQVLLHPGDLLFVPPTWWHVVEGCVDQEPGTWSCGINWFFTMPEGRGADDDSSEGERSEWEDPEACGELGSQLYRIAQPLRVSRDVVQEILETVESEPYLAKRRRIRN